MLLSLSFLALLLGPLLVWLARAHAWSTVILDSFCLVTVGGFALLHLLPESERQASWWVLPLALVGFLLPAVAERTIHHGTPTTRRTVLLLALLGIAAHATLDGLLLRWGSTVIDDGHPHQLDEMTKWAIILHRVPEGIGIWWIVPRTLGLWAAVLITIVSIASTLFGFTLGGELLTDQSRSGLALLQALLVGSLLHVVLHAHVPAPRQQGRFRLASVAGAALGVFVLWKLMENQDHFPPGPHGGPMGVFVRLAVESAPALLFAYALVGLCHAFLPANWLRRMTRGSTLSQALRGVAIGLPLPVCSCGVVPIYRELIRQGTSLAAGIAFLVATPELELAAVMLTWQLMGGEVALLRVGMAAVLALTIGLVTAALAGRRTPNNAPEPSDANLPEASKAPLRTRLLEAMRFGFGPAVDNTATWILAGLLLSAMLMPYIEPEWLAKLPPGLDVPIAALIGLPLYVCATGSTPLAAMLLVQGMSPGAVLALLLTGPATNVTTFGMLARLHGGRVAFGFALSMWLGAVGLGYLANVLLPNPVVPALAAGAHDAGPFEWACLGGLALVFLVSLLRQGTRPFLERLFESPANVAHGEAPDCCADDEVDHHHGHHHGHGHDHGHHHGPGAPCAADRPSTDTTFEPLVEHPDRRLRPQPRSDG